MQGHTQVDPSKDKATKLQIVLKNFTLYPTKTQPVWQNKNIEALKLDKNASSSTARIKHLQK